MTLNLEQLTAITRGAVRIEEQDGAFHFYRFSERQANNYLEANQLDFYARCTNTAGVRLAFFTSSTALSFDYNSKNRARDFFFFDVYKNGVMIAHFGENPISKTTQHAEVDLGVGEKLVEVYFPWSTAATISNVTLDDGATIRPHHRAHTAIHFGESITQGLDADYTSLSYANRLGRLLDIDAVNKAIAGDTFCPDILLTEPENLDPDLVTVSYGTNDWSHDVTKDQLRDSCRRFCQQISRFYPRAKIVIISPIWRLNFDKVTAFGSPAYTVHDVIAEAVEGIPSLTLVRGWNLVPQLPEFFADGYLHPNDEGFSSYAENLYLEIKKAFSSKGDLL